MGIFLKIIFGFLFFVFIRQLPSHKLHVVMRNLQEAQSYFASRVEEGILSDRYAEEYRAKLNQIQEKADALRSRMGNIWPFSIRDFYHIFSGVTSQCYKLVDEVEAVYNDMRRTSGSERCRINMYKTMTTPARPPSNGFFTDASYSSPVSPTTTHPAYASYPYPAAHAISTPSCSPDARLVASLHSGPSY